MVFVFTQVKHHKSLRCIFSQDKLKTMENLAKLRDNTVQTHVKVIRHLFPPYS
jgi:hypothetical protein